MPEPVYLDHHATTPCDPRVVEAMLPYFGERFGNPSSLIHHHGRQAANGLEDARITIARFFGVLPSEIYFTAGATESNNIALNLVGPGDHLITSSTEHRSVLAVAERLRGRNSEVTFLAPDREGVIAADRVEEAIGPSTRLVSIEAANGEIGTIQNIDSIGAVCRRHGVLFHTDATQAAGKIPLPLGNVDLASFSAHKLYGPKGIGALYSRRGVHLQPLVIGGGQEKNVRSGTVNVPGAVGFAAALALRGAEMAAEASRLTALRDELWERISSTIHGVSLNGPALLRPEEGGALRLPGNLNVSFERVEAEALLIAMKRFSLSSGSACSAGQRGPSHVLKAIGLTDETALGSIRIGLGKSNTAEIIEPLVDDLARAVRRIREISPR